MPAAYRAARFHEEDEFYTPTNALIDSALDDEPEADIAAFIALSLPRVADRQPPAVHEERATWL